MTASTTGCPTGSITARTRERALDRLANRTYDVIVVGGGITGAGVALDAAARGFRTALVERHDLAAGTSRWSSKLVHGGLRYLAKGDVAIAWESARERHALMTTIAPHLTRAMPNLVPLGASTPALSGVMLEAAIRLADGLRVAAGTPRSLLPRPSRISAAEARVLAPGLQWAGLRGALLYWDGQLEDDARLVTAIARTAAAHGADIVTRCSASALSDRSLTLRDELSGESFEARGHVVSATGVWAGEHEPSVRILPSRGSHLVVRAEAVGSPKAIFTAPVRGRRGRFVFAVPQPDGLVIVGLTDEPAPGVDGLAPEVPEVDTRFLLDTVNQALARPLSSQDVVGRYAGLRPLVEDGAGASADVSRRHLLVDEPGHPVTITGGKLTTYRQMAEDAVDAVCRRAGSSVACRTRSLPLTGAAPRDVLARAAAPARLVRRYGTEAPVVAALAAEHPDLAVPVSDSCPTLGTEFLFGVLHEGALTVEDLVERRTRVSFDEAALPAGRALAQLALDRAAEFAAHTPT
ncbi:glycerol-3-phosphate dehydrogenase/oxidase [Intrasporangium sp.]|uniref:glycerol-3-phosphate dehydrogenase/oxidase n=1 Tax=Intrasporangium sp. TaxID=1925024 RepID=UPI00293AF40C|nr:glycerol-3-phosphate dehydrogenase/oxidase [Intrasporangium sp.]MDV3220372.1 glycerol-3-phosphate dehydrogenase/oxidase [Intrasporangium sp.]